MAPAGRDRETGQTLADYALIMALIGIMAVFCLLWLGQDLAAVISNIGRSL